MLLQCVYLTWRDVTESCKTWSCAAKWHCTCALCWHYQHAVFQHGGTGRMFCMYNTYVQGYVLHHDVRHNASGPHVCSRPVHHDACVLTGPLALQIHRANLLWSTKCARNTVWLRIAGGIVNVRVLVTICTAWFVVIVASQPTQHSVSTEEAVAPKAA